MCQGAHTAEGQRARLPSHDAARGCQGWPMDREMSRPGFLVSVLARSIQLNDTTSYEEAVRILLDEQNGEKPYYVGPAKVA